MQIKCIKFNFDTDISYAKSFSNETILEIIPSKSPRIVYIETLKTDFNELIYNFGGILSLWFGLSPISATDLFIYFILLFKNNFYTLIISIADKVLKFFRLIIIFFNFLKISIKSIFKKFFILTDILIHLILNLFHYLIISIADNLSKFFRFIIILFFKIFILTDIFIHLILNLFHYLKSFIHKK